MIDATTEERVNLLRRLDEELEILTSTVIAAGSPSGPRLRPPALDP